MIFLLRRRDYKSTAEKFYNNQEHGLVEDLIVKDNEKTKTLKIISIFSMIILVATILIGRFTIALLHDQVVKEFDLLGFYLLELAK